MASIEIDGANGVIKSTVSDSDLTIKGNDGGSEISALTFDMSDAGTATFNHDIKLADNNKALFGDDGDFEIYHSGSASVIREAGAGNLILAGVDVNITNGAMNETHIDCNNNGSVDLYHDNSIKLQTSSTGVDITGGFAATAASTITSSSAGDLLTLKSTESGAEAGPNLVLYRESGSPADNDVLGRVIFAGEDDADNKTTYAQLTSQIIDAGDGSGGSEDSHFQLEVFNNGALRRIFDIGGGTSGQGEIVFNQPNQDMNFVIESSSNASMFVVDAGENSVFMNTASALGSGILQIEGQGKTNCIVMDSDSSSGGYISFEFGNTVVGNINTNGSTTSYVTSSDYRLKENVNYSWDATTELKKLKPAKFNFKADADKTVNGFLAHEVSDIVPEAVSGEKDAVDEDGKIKPQGIDQSKLVPLMVKTIQELEARIKALEDA